MRLRDSASEVLVYEKYYVRLNGQKAIEMRSQFDDKRWYAAQLVRVQRRPVENRPPTNNYMLIRLDFEIFIIYEHDRRLHSRGELACRDIIIGSEITPERDSGLYLYGGVLGVDEVKSMSSWQSRVRKAWIRLKFNAQREPETGRNPFDQFETFDSSGYLIKRSRIPLTSSWVGIRIASQLMGVSESTIRRKVDHAEKLGIKGLIERSPGGHRKINLVVLRNIWDDQIDDWRRE